MSRTLNLVDRLAERGRQLQAMGRTAEALHVLGSLARFRELPKALAADTECRLGEMHLLRGERGQAGGNLNAALRLQPDTARYHQLFAAALEEDEEADPNRSLAHYRRSLALDPNQPRCLCDFGLLALCLDQTKEGLAALRRAAELAPDDPEIIALVVDGLRDSGHESEARKTLIAALFRNSRDGRFRKLWNDFRFQQLHDGQQTERQKNGHPIAGYDGPKVLPFVRVMAEPARTQIGQATIRRDAGSRPSPPHTSRSARQRKRKHAQ